MSVLPKAARIRRVLAMTGAAAALVGGVAAGTAGTAAAATASPASCGDVWIGDHAHYMYQGVSAGWVDQFWDSCTDRVGVYWTWDATFRAQHNDATVDLYVGSPYGKKLEDVVRGFASNGDTAGGESTFRHGDADPDAWRAGAEINFDGCVEWGYLHWYGGQNWDGNRGGCNNFYAPDKYGNQPA